MRSLNFKVIFLAIIMPAMEYKESSGKWWDLTIVEINDSHFHKKHDAHPEYLNPRRELSNNHK
jgi:hypothetical protein